MNSPPASASAIGGSRRSRYSRSPSGGAAPPSKRSKPSSSGDGDQNRVYTSICVKNINPKIPDNEVRELCNKKFSKYGSNSVKIYYKNQERVAFVNFTNSDDARKARHAKSGLVWENIQIVLEPVYYRRTVPAEQPIAPASPRDRSPASPRRRPRRHSPSPPPRVRSPRPHRPSPPPTSSRPRRHYSPFIPLPPDLADYVTTKPIRNRQESSPSPVRDHRRRSPSKSPSPARSHSASPPKAYKSRSKTDDAGANRNESNVQHEPTRTLFVGNLERDIRESKIREIFGRYGTIEEVDLKVPQSSSKRAYAFIQYENMDMAYEARKAMDGHFIGKADCKIGYGKIVPTNCLWVGNISMDIKRRDLEQAFARYGAMKSFDYSTGDPAAIVTYNDIEDAIKARGKMTGVTQINDGRKTRAEPDQADASRRAGFRIDYLDRPTARRFVIVRPQDTTTSKRRQSRSPSASSVSSNHSRDRPQSISPEVKSKKKPSTPSRSPSPAKHQSPTPPQIGRTFNGPFGCYLSSNDTKNISDVEELIELCEKLNRSSPQAYSIQFVLKSHAYPARMHFLAGNPTLANQILGQPGDYSKKEFKVTQRFRLEQHKFDEVEKKLRASVHDALDNSQSSSRKSSLPYQTRFSILVTSAQASLKSSHQRKANGKNLSPGRHPSSSDENDGRTGNDEDDSSLSRFISYLASKEAAGVITIPFSFNETKDSSGEQETASVNIFPPCQFSKKILRNLCPSIHFSNGPHTPPSRPTSSINDEHLLLVIVHND